MVETCKVLIVQNPMEELLRVHNWVRPLGAIYCFHPPQEIYNTLSPNELVHANKIYKCQKLDHFLSLSLLLGCLKILEDGMRYSQEKVGAKKSRPSRNFPPQKPTGFPSIHAKITDNFPILAHLYSLRALIQQKLEQLAQIGSIHSVNPSGYYIFTW